MSSKLKLVAADIVFKSNLSKPAKLQMLNFIKEDASVTQIKALLMDGDIVTVDHLSESIIDARFKKYENFYNHKGEMLSIFMRESQDMTDSILFLLSARTAIHNIVESDKTITNEEKDEMADFIFNEASDYQIMHLLVYNEMPAYKYDSIAEEQLYSDFKESMFLNKRFVTEMIGQDVFDNILYEVTSISNNMSSQFPLLELGRQNDLDIDLACLVYQEELFNTYSQYLSEAPPRRGDILGKAGRALAKSGAGDSQSRAAATAKELAKRAGKKFSRDAKEIGGMAKSGAASVGSAAKKAGQAISQSRADTIAKRAHYAKFGAPLSRARGGPEPRIPVPVKAPSMAGDKALAASKAAGNASIGSKIAGRLKRAAGKTAVAAKQAKADIKSAAASTAQTAKDVGTIARYRTKAAISKAAGTVAAAGKSAAGTAAKFATSPAGMAVGGAAAAALAIYAGYKLYKRFFSQAAKACSNVSGAEKTACMAKFRKQAIIKQIAATQSGMAKCGKSKNPDSCKKAIAQKVASLKAKVAKIPG
jgi:hypothetical protein